MRVLSIIVVGSSTLSTSFAQQYGLNSNSTVSISNSPCSAVDQVTCCEMTFGRIKGANSFCVDHGCNMNICSGKPSGYDDDNTWYGGVKKNDWGLGKDDDLWRSGGAPKAKDKDLGKDDAWGGDKWGKEDDPLGSGGAPKTNSWGGGSQKVIAASASAILPSRRHSRRRLRRQQRRLNGYQWYTNQKTYYPPPAPTAYYPYPPVSKPYYPPAAYYPPPPPAPKLVETCCASREEDCPIEYPIEKQVLLSGKVRICCFTSLSFYGSSSGYGSSSYTDPNYASLPEQLCPTSPPTPMPTKSPTRRPSLAPFPLISPSPPTGSPSKSKSTPTQPTDGDGLFLLCRQVPGREGYGLPEYDPTYLTSGTPVFSKATAQDVAGFKVKASEAIKLTTTVIDTGRNVLGVLKKLEKLNAAFAVVSGIMSIIGLFVSKGETDPTKEIIKEIRQGFEEMNAAIKKLSDQVSLGFDLIRKDLSNMELDELMSSLQAMNFAYQEMQNVTLEENVPAQIKKLYTDRYRNACNRPHFTPEDIFRNLYGYACGENEKRSCKAAEAFDTGICKFGVKKRQYILDIIFDTAKGLTSAVGGFGNWLAEAMILAQFHYSVCLPEDATTCNDPVTDPIRKKISDDQVLAFQEVASNIERELTCIQNVTFAEYLSGHEFFKVAPNMKCFETVEHGKNGEEQVNGTEVNQCMAAATKKALESEFPSKEWTVVVYSKQKDSAVLDASTVVKKCQPTRLSWWESDTQAAVLRDGCISADNVKFDGFDKEEGRYFHLMYRSVDSKPKDYTNIVLMGNKKYVTLPELLKKEGIRKNFSGYCWIHPLDYQVGGGDEFPISPDFESEYRYSAGVLEAEQGYIAIRNGKGVDRAYDAGNFTIASDTIFWGEGHLIKSSICDCDDGECQYQGGEWEKGIDMIY